MFVGVVTRILLLICILPQHVAQKPIGEQLHMHVILRTYSGQATTLAGTHGLIGMPWVPHPGHADGEAVMKKYKRCEFVHGGIDLNSVFISVAALERSQASFAKLPTPCAGPTLAESTPGCRGIDARPYWVADYGLIYQVLAGGARATCLDTRPLFLQN